MNPTARELLTVSVVFRHGARTPVFDTPGLHDVGWDVCTKGLYASSLPRVQVRHADGSARPPLSRGVAEQVARRLPPRGGCHAGQLSDLGVAQAVALGERLRRLYGAHVPLGDPATRTGANGVLAVRSTNVPRCVASAQGVLRGLFGGRAGPSSFSTSSSSSDGQEGTAGFPVSTLPTAEEYATPNGKACPRVGDFFRAAGKDWQSALTPEAASALKVGSHNILAKIIRCSSYYLQQFPASIPASKIM